MSPATGSRLISVSADRIGRVWSLDRVRNPAGTVGRGIKRSASVRESEVLARLEDGDLPKPESSRFKVLYDGESSAHGAAKRGLGRTRARLRGGVVRRDSGSR